MSKSSDLRESVSGARGVRSFFVRNFVAALGVCSAPVYCWRHQHPPRSAREFTKTLWLYTVDTPEAKR